METSCREQYNWRNKIILIVEDEDLNFRVLQISLKNTNANIIRAVNGKDAVDKLNENKNVDIVLMDIQMPVMDGYEALSIIKRDYPHIPVIAQTAYAMMEEKKRCLELGFDDYISKPIKFNDLFAKVDQLFEKNITNS